MLSRSLHSVCILLVFMLFSTHCFALAKLGHQLVCQISYDHLSKVEQLKIDHLLAAIPEKHRQLINSYNHKNSASAITFADSCTWADAIKKLPDYKIYDPWHYINVSRDTQIITAQSCSEACVTQAILYHQEQLSNSQPLWEKTQALMFLGHWLGDVHQPMHVSFASDLGGNRVKLSTSWGDCNNLHWLWDECLLFNKNSDKENQTTKTNRQQFEQLQVELNNQWSHSPITLWQQDPVWQWATESLLLTRAPELGYCKINQQQQCLPLNELALSLSESYHEKFSPVIKARVLQAAARLNNLLKLSL